MAIPSTLLFASLLLMLATGQSTEALVVNGLTIAQVSIGGIISCSIDGNPSPTGPANVIAGIPVHILCGNGNGNGNGNSDQVLKTAITDLSGKYTFVFNVIDALLFDPTKCYIEIDLPLGSCVVAPHTGLLRAPIGVLNIVQSLLGYILIGIVGPFTYIA